MPRIRRCIFGQRFKVMQSVRIAGIVAEGTSEGHRKGMLQ